MIDVNTKAGMAKSFSLRGSSGHGAYAGGGEARQADVPVDAWDVAKRLVKLMKYDINLSARPTKGQWSRWVLEFCDDFEVHAKAEREQRWIVVDGFGSVVLAQSALDLIRELTNRLNQSLYLLRLVLLGFVETLPGPVLGHVEEEEIKAIGHEDLLEFFARAFEEMGLPLDEEKLLNAAERVLAKVDFSANDCLVKLEPLANGELTRAARG